VNAHLSTSGPERNAAPTRGGAEASSSKTNITTGLPPHNRKQGRRRRYGTMYTKPRRAPKNGNQNSTQRRRAISERQSGGVQTKAPRRPPPLRGAGGSPMQDNVPRHPPPQVTCGGRPTARWRDQGDMTVSRRSGCCDKTSKWRVGVSPHRGGEVKAAWQCCGVQEIAPRHPPPPLGSPHGAAVS